MFSEVPDYVSNVVNAFGTIRLVVQGRRRRLGTRRRSQIETPIAFDEPMR